MNNMNIVMEVSYNPWWFPLIHNNNPSKAFCFVAIGNLHMDYMEGTVLGGATSHESQASYLPGGSKMGQHLGIAS